MVSSTTFFDVVVFFLSNILLAHGDVNDTATICEIFAEVYDCTNITNICDESGVNCTASNDVFGIDWSSEGLSGLLNWNKNFPDSLEYLDLSNNNLTGEFDFSAFGASSRIINIFINSNQFTSISNVDIITCVHLKRITIGMWFSCICQ